MKKFFKVASIIFSLILFLAFVGYAYMMTQFPKAIPVRDIKISSTPEMIERGKYLANSFAGCTDCHSKRDYNKFGGPVIPGSEGAGGVDYGEGAGSVPAKNITSDKETGIGSWTDGEIFRAITSGIDKDGNALGPMMPYKFYGKMDEEDIKAIIAYIKTLSPIKNEVPAHDLNFPVNLIFRTIPEEPKFGKRPAENNKISLGEYYAISCKFCHSTMDKGEFIEEKLFSGGTEFPNPKGGIERSANISPDKETGIGSWTKEQFIERFRSYLKPEIQNVNLKDGEFNSIMPWTFFATATDSDLGAVYDYLMVQKPVKNKVEKFSPREKVFGK
ncbi:MAG: cytochrome c [Ignavibacteria bacterium]